MGVGENFILGFHGTKVPEWVRDFANDFSLGGVILFDYYCQTKKYENNIESPSQVRDLCAAIHELPGRPLVFIDQEGGKVRRLKDGLGFQPLPSQTQMNLLSPQQQQEALLPAYRELHDLGIDFNLAPVVDIIVDPDNTDIVKVERSYSNDAEDIRRNVQLLAATASEFGVQLCLKHFPGVAGVKANAHGELLNLSGVINEGQLALFYDLAPVIPGSAVLVSHGIVDDWDEGVPLSASPAAVERLRRRVPEVLLISDDMHMEGLQLKLGTEEATVRGLRAGMDLMLIGNNMRNEEKECHGFAERVEKERSQDKEFADTLLASQRRIQARKDFSLKRKG